MPDILISMANLAALSSVHPLDKDAPIKPWAFRFCPYPRGLYTFLVRTNAAAQGLSHSISIGTTEVVAESHTSVGGTPGVMPTPAGATATPAHQFYAEQGDEVDLVVNELGNVATSDVTIWANVEPA